MKLGDHGRPGGARGKSTATQVVVGAAVAFIDPSCTYFGKLHCFVTLRSSSHGFLFPSPGSPWPKLNVAPSLVVLLTGRPLFSKPLTRRGTLLRRGFAGERPRPASQQPRLAHRDVENAAFEMGMAPTAQFCTAVAPTVLAAPVGHSRRTARVERLERALPGNSQRPRVNYVAAGGETCGQGLR